MPVKQTQAKEAKTPYRPKRKAAVTKSSSEVMLRWAEIESATEPIVLERNGQPVAVVIKYADYRQMEATRAEHREMAWRELDALLARVHARTQAFSSEEIEADITAARQEVREQHHALRDRG
jgi:PHD/YefM family antitoxin component YafN of YafNO toxin-antitoxin module